MADLRLLANMNISPETVNALSEKGVEIVRVSQILPVTSSDQEILDLDWRENRVVLTQDLDFSALLALGGYRDMVSGISFSRCSSRLDKTIKSH